MSFEYFTKGNVTDFLDWMLNTRNYSEKTCNLRITAINSLLEYAANEDNEAYMAIYLDVRTVKGLKIHNGPIEFFEEYQMNFMGRVDGGLLPPPLTEFRTCGFPASGSLRD